MRENKLAEPAPKCFGCRNGKGRSCLKCTYHESCRLCASTEPAMNSRLGGVCFDEVSPWASELADYTHIPGEDLWRKRSGRNYSDLSEMLRYLLFLDDYTLGILAEILIPSPGTSGTRSVSELARLHGISRQGMHRKALAICGRFPELAALMGLAVRKIRNSRRHFRKEEAGQ